MPSVWCNGNFRKLWVGHAVTQLGSEITLLALPLVAATLLNASSLEMGMLLAAEQLPPLLIGLFAGVVVDWYEPKWFLVWSDISRAVLLGTIALTAWLGLLDFALLTALAMLISIFRTFFDASYGAFLPRILERADLVEGNARLGLARSFSEMIGPPFAGLLISVLSAANALLLDALSFLSSAACLTLVRPKRKAKAPATRYRGIWHEMLEGVRAIKGHEVRRSLAVSGATWNFFYAAVMAVFILYATNDLGVTPWLLGIVFVPGGIGFMAGAWMTKASCDRFGLGPTTILGITITAGWSFLIAAATGGHGAVTIFLMAATFLFGLGQAMFNITGASITQMITPIGLLGRVGATSQVLYRSTLPAGALFGGFLGDQIGLRATVAVGAVGLLASAGFLVLSPARRFLHVIPELDEHDSSGLGADPTAKLHLRCTTMGENGRD